MKAVLFILITFHGLVHLLGFFKAFNLVALNHLAESISRVSGILWLVATLLFFSAALSLFLKKDLWWIFAAFAILISQYLIFTSWHDAKFGTIANVIILISTVIGYGTWNFTRRYTKEVKTGLKQLTVVPESLLSEKDIQDAGTCEKISSLHRCYWETKSETFQNRIRWATPKR